MKPATPCPLWSVLHSSPKPYSFEPMKRIIFGLPRDTGTEVFLAFVYPIDPLTSAMPGGTAMRNTGQELYLLYITIPKYTVKSFPKCIHWKQMLHRLSVDSRSPIDRQSTNLSGKNWKRSSRPKDDHSATMSSFYFAYRGNILEI